MSGTASSVAAAALTALAVKLMDDALDEQRDRAARRPNWAAALAGGAGAYALAAFAVAAALDGRLAAALLLGAFAAGMGTGRERLPLGLRAWQEGLVALGLAALLCGWRLAAGGALAAAAAQAADGLLDGHIRWGAAETALAGAAAAAGSAALAPAALAATGAGLLISLLTRRA